MDRLLDDDRERRATRRRFGARRRPERRAICATTRARRRRRAACSATASSTAASSVWGRDARRAPTLERARVRLERRLGRSVVGYRSPRLDRSPDLAWALDRAGFRYDSSYPDVDRENMRELRPRRAAERAVPPAARRRRRTLRPSRCLELPLTAPDCIQPLFAGESRERCAQTGREQGRVPRAPPADCTSRSSTAASSVPTTRRGARRISSSSPRSCAAPRRLAARALSRHRGDWWWRARGDSSVVERRRAPCASRNRGSACRVRGRRVCVVERRPTRRRHAIAFAGRSQPRRADL